MLHFKRLLVHTSAYVEPSKRDLRPYFWARPFFLDRLPTHLSTGFFANAHVCAVSIHKCTWLLPFYGEIKKDSASIPRQATILPAASYSFLLRRLLCNAASRAFSTLNFFSFLPLGQLFLWPKFNRFTECRALASSSLRLLLSAGTFNKKRGRKKLI